MGVAGRIRRSSMASASRFIGRCSVLLTSARARRAVVVPRSGWGPSHGIAQLSYQRRGAVHCSDIEVAEERVEFVAS